ncbi:hypothetical protein LCGC14_1872210 [marine sediment metagenome]|uniref:HNH nuclease domain-containing protein n=1 Tax=marine sediment metagenome TaxID=412755 RepID=A0A0F9J3E4_9ZZZZ|nr:HNH endonuclease [Candidatus Scalindua sp.]
MPTGVYKRIKKHLKQLRKQGFQKGHKLGFQKGYHPKNEFKKGHIPWIKDKHHTKKSKEKNRQAMLGKMMGKDNPNWQNGKSFEPYSTDWTETLKRSIRERDNYICQVSGQYGNSVHHIDYDKKNCNPDNLITLCKRCNSKVNSNRKYWTNYFQQI